METILITTSTFGAAGSDPLTKIDGEVFNVVLNPHGRRLTEAEVKGLIDEYQPVGMIAGVEILTSDVFKTARRLKVISRCGAGADSIDMESAAERGITITLTPDATTVPVAELTLGLILNLLRRIHTADASIRGGGWERPMGELLYKKFVGIIGLGRIGTHLARFLVPFDCRLLGSDPNVKEHAYCVLVELDRLLSESDIVSLHIPYSRDNHHFISSDELSKMKGSSYLINAARGGLVDEEALYAALKSGVISGAALDCYEEEPYTGKLRGLPNVLLSSHIGSYAREARAMMEDQAVDNLLRELNKAGVI